MISARTRIIRNSLHVQEVVFGTGKGLLWYGICARCAKQPPGVPNAFSEAFGVKNRLFWYRSDIRYRKPHFLVPNRHRCAEQAPVVRGASVAPSAKSRLLWYAMRFQGPPMHAAAPSRPFGHIEKSAFCSCRKPIPPPCRPQMAT